MDNEPVITFEACNGAFKNENEAYEFCQTLYEALLYATAKKVFRSLVVYGLLIICQLVIIGWSAVIYKMHPVLSIWWVYIICRIYWEMTGIGVVRPIKRIAKYIQSNTYLFPGSAVIDMIKLVLYYTLFISSSVCLYSIYTECVTTTLLDHYLCLCWPYIALICTAAIAKMQNIFREHHEKWNAIRHTKISPENTVIKVVAQDELQDKIE